MTKKSVVFTGTAVVLVALALGIGYRLVTEEGTGEQIALMTWNVRGYPEKTQDRREWFSEQLTKIKPHLICIQEIANQDRVDTFLQVEAGFTQAAFLDSSDGQDNAIFAVAAVGM